MQRRAIASDARFNSRLVRLKVLLASCSALLSFLFQFQIGSIKRLSKSHKLIIHPPDGTCQLIFSRIDFSCRFAVNRQSCKIAERLTALDETWAGSAFCVKLGCMRASPKDLFIKIDGRYEGFVSANLQRFSQFLVRFQTCSLCRLL